MSERPTKTNLRELAHAIGGDIMSRFTFATTKDTEELLVYQDGVYNVGGETLVKQEVQDIASPGDLGNNLVNEVLGNIKRSTYVDRSIFGGANPHLVAQNCLLNVETMQPEPFSPNIYELAKLPVVYDPTKDCPAWKQFISEVLSEEDVLGVQEELGAILRKKYLTKKFSIYLGETDTGKTTLINALLALLGKDNVSSVSMQQLGSRDRFAVAELYGKLANIRDDLPKDVVDSVGKLKEITGGFPVQAEHKFRDPFTFTNSAYLVFTCNNLPPVSEDDAAFFNRVQIRLFTRKYGGKADPDRELLTKLTTPDELSGILNWGLEGLTRLRNNGWNFSSTGSLDSTREDYKRRSDPVWAFVQDCLKEDSQGVVSKEKLYNLFRQWSLERGVPLLSKDGFYKALPEKVHVESAYRTPPGERGRKHCFVGCVLNGESPAQPAQPAPDQGSLP